MNFAKLFLKKASPDKTKIAIVDDIEYKYTKKRCSKTIKISIKGANRVSVTMPYYCPYKVAQNFVEEKSEWIKSKLEIAEFDKIDENYQTKTNNLIISTGLIKKPVIKKTGRIIQFIYPIGEDFYSSEIQKMAALALKKALYIEASEYLPKRLEQLAVQYGFKYKKVSLKTAKTRWGSCSFINNINLNINLMTLNDKIIDYVLIHELCHTIEKNHGERFWALVEKCIVDAKEIRKELKKKKFVV